MAKRGANTYLTHDNWNDEEGESEEPGVFTTATNAVLQKREIKKAKRRTTTGAENSGSGSAFQGFSFTAGNSNGQSSVASPVVKPFSFVVDTSKAQPTLSNSGSLSTESSSTLASGTTSETSSGTASTSASHITMSTTQLAEEDETESEYRRNLRNLNESVLTWMGDHIARNPYCILSPIFADYERYIVELDKEYPYSSNLNLTEDTDKKNITASSSVGPREESTRPVPGITAPTSSSLGPTAPTLASKSITAPTQTSSNSESKFTFGSFTTSDSQKTGFSFSTNTTSSSGTSDPSTKSLFSFGAKSPSSSAATTSGLGLFSFGSGFTSTTTPVFSTTTTMSIASSFGTGFFSAPKTSDATLTGGITSTGVLGAFGTSAGGKLGEGFSFGGTPSLFGKPFPAPTGEAHKEEAGAAGGGGGEDEEYVPPKPEVVETKEEGAFYSIRCKLFYKKDDKFQERGIGFLHLKSCGDNGEKTQLLVRTDTALGNILLNIMLNKNIPVGRQGNNNLTMMCIPNPPIDEKKAESKTPVLMLIRVKTKDDADELMKQLNECKAKC